MTDHSKANSSLNDWVQAALDESSGKLQETEQALQSMQSSSTAQQVQLTQQLTCQTEQLAAAHQVKHAQHGRALVPVTLRVQTCVP